MPGALDPGLVFEYRSRQHCDLVQIIDMAAIVQRLERLIVVQDVVGSNPTSRPIFFWISHLRCLFFGFDGTVIGDAEKVASLFQLF